MWRPSSLTHLLKASTRCDRRTLENFNLSVHTRTFSLSPSFPYPSHSLIYIVVLTHFTFVCTLLKGKRWHVGSRWWCFCVFVWAYNETYKLFYLKAMKSKHGNKRNFHIESSIFHRWSHLKRCRLVISNWQLCCLLPNESIFFLIACFKEQVAKAITENLFPQLLWVDKKHYF